MNLNNFVVKQLELIEIEKNAEIDESKDLLNNCNLQQLQSKGLCLLKLKIDQKYTGLYGRTILVLNSAIIGRQINTQHFSSGDIVSVSENSVAPSQLNTQKDLITGTVTKVTSQSVSVAIDNEIENLYEKLNDNETYKIIKLCNDVTYKRIKNALVNLKDTKLNERSSHLADVLFLNEKPEQTDNLSYLDEGTTTSLEFFNKKLDKSQQEAVKFTFQQKDLAIIHGPPGTGKTTTLVEIIKQNCLKYKQKILCCAPSNIAVDNIVERLAVTEPGYEKMKMIRLGHPARLLEQIQEYSLDSVLSKSDQYKLANDIKEDMEKTLKSIKSCNTQRGERECFKRDMRELRKELYQRENRAIKEVLQNSNCILATLTVAHEDGLLKNLKENHFDIIIIDECSQAMEAACWIPLIIGARKLILAGDHLQLPPTIISKEASKNGLDLTLMKRLIDALGDQSTRMLTIQYRMNKLIMNWISEKLYKSRLEAHESVREHLLCDLPGVERDDNTMSALVLIDTDGCEMYEMVAVSDQGSNNNEESKANDMEANIVCRHVDDLIKKNVKQENIAVITPYNLQIELIKAKLHTKYPQVEVKSVDGFQGREKEAIILSLVRSNTRGEVGFLADERRINVAITRARRHLCVICDSQTCKANEFLKDFLKYCETHADVRSGFDYMNDNYNISDSEIRFEDIKFQKLKISDGKKPTKKESNATATTNKNNKKESKKGTFHDTKTNEPTNVQNEDEDKQLFRNEVTRIIENLKTQSNQRLHEFSCSLNSYQRRVVHELAEKYNIHHLTIEKNEKRHIIISTDQLNNTETTLSCQVCIKLIPQRDDKSIESESNETKNVASVEDLNSLNIENKFETINEDTTTTTSAARSKKKKSKPIVKDNINKESADKVPSVTKKTNTTNNKNENLLGELDSESDFFTRFRSDCKECTYCKKFILQSSFLMHELHCSKLQRTTTNKENENKTTATGTTTAAASVAAANFDSANKSSSSSASASKTTKLIKKNPIETAKTDDFDELLELFQKSNDICNFKGCKTLVKTLGQNCDFCRHRFCLQHSLAEIHGCGDEAKKQARAHIKRTGNLDINEKQTSYSQQIKHKYVEKKFHEKMETLKSSRTRSNKKD